MASMEITTRIGCRIACVYCPQALLIDAYPKRSRDFLMHIDVFEQCIRKIPTDVAIHFSGMCEPWLNPACTQMVKFAHEAGHEVCVFTTLVGMTPSDVKVLQTIPFTAFVVHLPSVEGHEKIIIDDRYLSTLHCLKDSGIVTSWVCQGSTVNALLQPIVGHEFHRGSLSTRAGNVEVSDREMIRRRRGQIRCIRDLRQNVLLPNGDVLLCCNDYGMKHVLGNLREQDYESLFTSEEFLLVERGLKDASLDTLCRQCDCMAQNVSLSAKAWNKSLPELLGARTPREFLSLVPKTVVGLRRHLQDTTHRPGPRLEDMAP